MFRSNRNRRQRCGKKQRVLSVRVWTSVEIDVSKVTGSLICRAKEIISLYAERKWRQHVLSKRRSQPTTSVVSKSVTNAIKTKTVMTAWYPFLEFIIFVWLRHGTFASIWSMNFWITWLKFCRQFWEALVACRWALLCFNESSCNFLLSDVRPCKEELNKTGTILFRNLLYNCDVKEGHSRMLRAFVVIRSVLAASGNTTLTFYWGITELYILLSRVKLGHLLAFDHWKCHFLVIDDIQCVW